MGRGRGGTQTLGSYCPHLFPGHCSLASPPLPSETHLADGDTFLVTPAPAALCCISRVHDVHLHNSLFYLTSSHAAAGQPPRDCPTTWPLQKAHTLHIQTHVPQREARLLRE